MIGADKADEAAILLAASTITERSQEIEKILDFVGN
jgi:hypothetical protein